MKCSVQISGSLKSWLGHSAQIPHLFHCAGCPCDVCSLIKSMHNFVSWLCPDIWWCRCNFWFLDMMEFQQAGIVSQRSYQAVVCFCQCFWTLKHLFFWKPMFMSRNSASTSNVRDDKLPYFRLRMQGLCRRSCNVTKFRFYLFVQAPGVDCGRLAIIMKFFSTANQFNLHMIHRFQESKEPIRFGCSAILLLGMKPLSGWYDFCFFNIQSIVLKLMKSMSVWYMFDFHSTWLCNLNFYLVMHSPGILSPRSTWWCHVWYQTANIQHHHMEQG